MPLLRKSAVAILHAYYPRRAWAATSIVVCLFVCLFVTGESAHLGAMALRLQPSHNKLLVLIVADFDVTPSLSNENEQKLRSLCLSLLTWMS